jgi:hypothetical protein
MVTMVGINLVVAVMLGDLDPGSLCASGMTTGDVW